MYSFPKTERRPVQNVGNANMVLFFNILFTHLPIKWKESEEVTFTWEEGNDNNTH